MGFPLLLVHLYIETTEQWESTTTLMHRLLVYLASIGSVVMSILLVTLIGAAHLR